MAIDISQFRPVFLEEAAEYLATAESLLLYLNPGAPDAEQIEDIYRAVHSVKGASATFGYKAMADLAQQMQTLLDGVRKGAGPLGDEALAALVEACRVLRALLAAHRDGAEADTEAVARAAARLARAGEAREAVVPLPLDGGAGPPGGSVEPASAARLSTTAAELRELAQRAAAAARDVAQMVRERAGGNAALARDAEESIGDMMSSFGRLEGVVVGMAAAAARPEAREIVEAMRRLGEAIRQNELRARKSAQSAELLRGRFEALAQAVSRLAMPDAAQGGVPPGAGAKRGGRALPKFRRVAGADGEEGWPEF